jgi:hypothetical protein
LKNTVFSKVHVGTSTGRYRNILLYQWTTKKDLNSKIFYENIYLGTRQKAILLGEPHDDVGALPQAVVRYVGGGAAVGLAGEKLPGAAGQNPDFVTETVRLPAHELLERVGTIIFDHALVDGDLLGCWTHFLRWYLAG